jgi:hypothetical protein
MNVQIFRAAEGACKQCGFACGMLPPFAVTNAGL